MGRVLWLETQDGEISRGKKHVSSQIVSIIVLIRIRILIIIGKWWKTPNCKYAE